MNRSSFSFQILGLRSKTLLSLLLFIGLATFSFAQECFKEEPSNDFELAFGSTGDVEIADEIIIPENENFILEKFTFNLWLLESATVDLALVSLRFYEHEGVFPAARFGEVDLAPSKDTIIGIRTFGADVYNVHQITLELETPVRFEGKTDEATIYWIGVFTPNPPSYAGYESSNESSSQILSSFYLNGTWRNSYSNGQFFLDKACVFKAEGQCEDKLTSTNNINLDSRISIFPNPTNSLLNIDIPSDINVQNILLYDFLGNRTGISSIKNQLDVSSLGKGIYLVHITTDEGTIIKKIIKQ